MKVLVSAGVASSLTHFRRELIDDLQARGHEVLTAAGTAPPASHGPRLPRFNAFRMSRNTVAPVEDLKYYRALRSLVRRERPDVTLAYTHKAAIFTTMAASAEGVPNPAAMITGLGYAFTAGGASLRRLAVRASLAALYRRALHPGVTVFFQNGDDLALFSEQQIVPRGVRTVLLPGSGVSLEHYAYEPADTTAHPRFLMLSRLLRNKGVREYVAAARAIRRVHPQAEFHLAGLTESGPNGIGVDELRAWVEEGVVEYHGFASDPRPLLRRATVYVLPSYREGTPRSVLEAMAIGRAIVTTDAPGCRDTVREGVNGFLVPVRDVETLVCRLSRFIGNAGLAAWMGRESRRLAAERFDVRLVNQAIYDALGL